MRPEIHSGPIAPFQSWSTIDMPVGAADPLRPRQLHQGGTIFPTCSCSPRVVSLSINRSMPSPGVQVRLGCHDPGPAVRHPRHRSQKESPDLPHLPGESMANPRCGGSRSCLGRHTATPLQHGAVCSAKEPSANLRCFDVPREFFSRLALSWAPIRKKNHSCPLSHLHGPPFLVSRA